MTLSIDRLIIIAFTFLLIGGLIHWLYQRIRFGTFKELSHQILQQAEVDAEKKVRAAELDILSKYQIHQKQIESNQIESQNKLRREHEHLYEREKKIDSQLTRLEKQLSDIERKDRKAQRLLSDVEEQQQKLDEEKKLINLHLERLSGITCLEAKGLLMEKMQQELLQESTSYIKKFQIEIQQDVDKIATKMILTSINRLAISCVSDAQNHTIALPNEEIKRRIIGKEGRNIKTLEMLTGINLSMDITPGAIVLSGFDPVRMYTAKAVLTELINDGRIHPSKIEEVYEKCRINVNKQIIKFGEEAAVKGGILGLHPEMVRLLGQLKFRYSLGQNVLEHSLEVSHLMGMIAAELHLDIRLAKRIGLLHDIGKAVSHEMEGSHALIGRDLALKFGENQDVANGIGCHHDEIEPLTLEGALCKAADTLSAARPGARNEPIEEYVKRLKRLEVIAHRFEGVETAYALQAGRELRIFVKPEMIDDTQALHLARDISKQIEKELTYPGRIKVTVSREKRIVEYAL